MSSRSSPGIPATAELFGSGDQPPEQPEAFPLPADHRIRIDDDESVGPVAPDSAKEDPEYPIRRSQSGSGVPLLEDGLLLALGEVLDHQFPPGPEQYPGKSNRQCPNEANHAASIAGGPPMGKANAFLAGSEGPRNQPLRNNVEGHLFFLSLRSPLAHYARADAKDYCFRAAIARSSRREKTRCRSVAGINEMRHNDAQQEQGIARRH